MFEPEAWDDDGDDGLPGTGVLWGAGGLDDGLGLPDDEALWIPLPEACYQGAEQAAGDLGGGMGHAQPDLASCIDTPMPAPAPLLGSAGDGLSEGGLRNHRQWDAATALGTTPPETVPPADAAAPLPGLTAAAAAPPQGKGAAGCGAGGRKKSAPRKDRKTKPKAQQREGAGEEGAGGAAAPSPAPATGGEAGAPKGEKEAEKVEKARGKKQNQQGAKKGKQQNQKQGGDQNQSQKQKPKPGKNQSQANQKEGGDAVPPKPVAVPPAPTPPAPAQTKAGGAKEECGWKQLVSSEALSVLKPHQVEGIDFMWGNLVGKKRGCVLAHGMGLGKTCQLAHLALALSKQWQSEGKPLRVVVVAPVPLIAPWRSELTKWYRLEDPDTLAGLHLDEMRLFTSDDRNRIASLRAWHAGGGVLLTTYDRLSVDAKAAFPPEEGEGGEGEAAGGGGGGGRVRCPQVEEVKSLLFEGASLILTDEAQKLKNKGTQAARAMSAFSTQLRVAATGTPLENKAQDLLSIIDFAVPGMFNVEEIQRWCKGIEFSSGVQEKDAVRKSEVLAKALTEKFKEVLHRRDDSILRAALPPLTEYLVKLRLSPLQQELWQEYIKQTTQSATGRNDLFEMRAVCSRTSLHPAALHAHSLEVPERYAWLQQAGLLQEGQATDPKGCSSEWEALSPKLQAVRTIVSQAVLGGEKVLIFSQFKESLQFVHAYLQRAEPHTSVEILTGEDKEMQRAAKLTGMHNHETDVLLLTFGVGSVGLTITTATRVVILESGWNPAIMKQAMFRAYRYGQTRPVFVYTLVAEGTMEQAMFKQTLRKEWIQQRLVEGTTLERTHDSSDTTAYYTYRQEQRVPVDSSLCNRDAVVAALRGPSLVEAVATDTLLKLEQRDLLEGAHGDVNYAKRALEAGGCTQAAADLLPAQPHKKRSRVQTTIQAGVWVCPRADDVDMLSEPREEPQVAADTQDQTPAGRSRRMDSLLAAEVAQDLAPFPLRRLRQRLEAVPLLAAAGALGTVGPADGYAAYDVLNLCLLQVLEDGVAALSERCTALRCPVSAATALCSDHDFTQQVAAVRHSGPPWVRTMVSGLMALATSPVAPPVNIGRGLFEALKLGAPCAAVLRQEMLRDMMWAQRLPPWLRSVVSAALQAPADTGITGWVLDAGLRRSLERNAYGNEAGAPALRSLAAALGCPSTVAYVTAALLPHAAPSPQSTQSAQGLHLGAHHLHAVRHVPRHVRT